MPHTYAVADLHGRYDLFQQIKDFISPEDTVYVLGDCADRGPDGWKIIKEVYNNPQFIYIKGNHEDLLVDAIRTDYFDLWYWNGGEPTHQSWLKDPEGMDWVEKLDKLPTHFTYLNQNDEKVILCHAGYTPSIDTYIEEHDLIWSRKHFNQKWNDDFLDTIIVHGHTPIPYMDDYLFMAPPEKDMGPEAYWYSRDHFGCCHKVNIDCGAVFTGFTVLLDLDTWEEHIFMTEDCIYND